MANLSITSLCNQSCAYCFAGAAFNEKRQKVYHMSRDFFSKALDLLERSGIDQVRLLGGEPTLHPDFSRFVDKILEREMRILVFTNGLMPEHALNALSKTTEEQVSVLINVAEPEKALSKEQKLQKAVFKQLGQRVILGINIYSPKIRFDFLPDLIDKFSLSKAIRLGLANPCVSFNNHYLHPQYYSRVGNNILSFATLAYERKIDLEFDCGFVPCMFSGDGLDRLGKTFDAIGRRCNPLPDILPDGSVTPCYSLARLFREPLSKDLDTKGLQDRFEKKMAVYRGIGIFRKCSTCSFQIPEKCKGGCLAATLNRIRQTPFSFTIGKSDSERVSSYISIAQSHTTQRDDKTAPHGHSPIKTTWVIPYIDQPVSFWEQVADTFQGHIKEIYFPLPGNIVPSGRPVQPAQHLEALMNSSLFPLTVLINPIILPRPAEKIAPSIIEVLQRLDEKNGLTCATVSNLMLAEKIKEALPELSLTASVLMDIYQSHQALMLNGIFDNLVPASRIMRDISALKTLKDSFSGKIRLIVNEACLSACPFRLQHFFEMGSDLKYPESLCSEILARYPWMRLTGAWVLPQHLHFYEEIYDDLKIAGRVTLKDPDDYLIVLDAYVHGKQLSPDRIGGGPASVQEPIEISEAFFSRTLTCGYQCDKCNLCQDYYKKSVNR